MNLEEYIEYLYNLKKKGDILMIEKIIKENNQTFKFELKNLEEIVILREKIKIRKFRGL